MLSLFYGIFFWLSYCNKRINLLAIQLSWLAPLMRSQWADVLTFPLNIFCIMCLLYWLYNQIKKQEDTGSLCPFGPCAAVNNWRHHSIYQVHLSQENNPIGKTSPCHNVTFLATCQMPALAKHCDLARSFTDASILVSCFRGIFHYAVSETQSHSRLNNAAVLVKHKTQNGTFKDELPT